MPILTEFLLIFAAGLAGMFGIYELLDGDNNDEEAPEVGESAPSVDDLVLGDLTTIAGDADDNILSGTTDAERIEGGDGEDTITGNGGSDQILGGAGDDTIDGSGLVFGQDGNDTLSTDDADTSLVGGAGNDLLTATAGADMYGGAGTDTITGVADATATGGADADLFVAGADNNNLGIFTITDFDPTQDDLAFDLGSGEVVTAVGTTPLEGETEGLTVSVTIGQSDGSGTPRIELVQLNGITDAGVVDDLQTRDGDGVPAPLTPTTVTTGTDAAETLAGGDGADIINALGGDDSVSGGLGANTVTLGAGDDTYVGGGNAEQIQGGNGDDTITDVLPTTGEAGAIRFDGGSGNDVLTAVRAEATLVGGFGDDTLTLGNERGVAVGSQGADTLVGGDGDDIFLLDEEDTVTGGAGDDLFELLADANDADANATTITDFAQGADVIRIVVPTAGDTVTVQDVAGAAGQPDNAVILVNGDEVAIVTGAGGLTLADINVAVA